MRKSPRYIPAFHFHWLTRWYDPVMRRLFPEEALKTALIAQARIQPSQNVLDAGCGTGTLILLIKQTQPDATVHGLDMDPEVLEIARRKTGQVNDFLRLAFCY
ncbi:MAG: class I SAM-dependent methyltransferase, partial [Pseudomonadota bacterium]